MARDRGRSRKNSVKVNFEGVESRTLVPEADYPSKVVEVTLEEGDKAKYLAWKWEITEGKFEGSNLFINTSLAPKALWNLKNLLTCLGVEVPDDELDIELDELVDLEAMLVVGHEVYENKRQAKVVDFYALEEDDKKDDKKKDRDDDKSERRRGRDKDEKEERSSKRDKKGGKKDLDPKTEEEIEDMDEDELADVVKEYDLDLDLDEFRSRRKKISAVIEAMEEAGHIAEPEKEEKRRGR